MGRIASLAAIAAALSALAAGCGSSERTSRAPLTERQRDSVIAASSLPGAPVVGRALRESDRATSRAADLDSLMR